MNGIHLMSPTDARRRRQPVTQRSLEAIGYTT